MRFTAYILIAFLAFSCKKYPENNLWFKNPKKLTFVCGKITAYTVNGIDSLPFLDSYFKEPNVQFSNSIIVCKPIHKDGLHEFSFLANLSTGQKTLFNGSCVYRNNCKTLKIAFYQDTTYYKKNIFIQTNLDWDIVYLSKKDNKRKMKTKLSNGNIYEIQFN